MFRDKKLTWSELVRTGVVSLLAVSVWGGTDVLGGEADLDQRGPAAITTGFKPILGGAIIEESIRSLEIDRELIPAIKQELRKEGRVVLKDVPLPDGGSINLELYERNVFPAGARLVVEFGDRPEQLVSQPLALPKSALVMSGHIQGDEGSFAALALWDGGTMGLFQGAHGTSVLSSGKVGELKDALVYDPKHARDGVFGASTWECHTDGELPVDLEPVRAGGDRADRHQGGLAGEGVCELIELGIEYDYEMYNDVLGADGLATIVYTAFLVMGLDEIYRRDLGVQMQCTFVKVRSDPSDPWFDPPAGSGSRLDQLIAHYADEANDYDPWNPDWRPDIYTLLSGRSGGGSAQGVGVICRDPAHVFLASMRGTFPYPLETEIRGNWDIFGTAHEFGHVLGSRHTFQYCPPLDTCWTADAVDCTDSYTQACMPGTLMSYCHTCSGGLSNIRLEFHDTVKSTIRSYLDGVDCTVLQADGIMAVDDEAQTARGVPTTIDVVANDQALCAYPRIRGMNAWSDAGGSLAFSWGTGPFGRDEVLYTPPAGFPDGILGVDQFSYTAEDGSNNLATANVTIKVWGVTLEYLLVDSGRLSIERFDASLNQHIGPLVEDASNLLTDPSASCIGPNGKLLVADVGIDKILAFDPGTGEFLDTFHSSQYIEHPIDVVSTESHVYVGSRDKQSVAVLNAAGEVESILQSGGHVQDLFLDEESGLLVVLRDSGNFSGGYELWDLANEQMLMMQPTSELETASCIAVRPDGDYLVGDSVAGGIARYNAANQGFAGWFLHWQVARFFGIGEPTRIEVGLDELVYVASSTGVHRLTLEGWYVDEVELADNESFEAPGAFLFLEPTVNPADVDGNGKVDGVDLAKLLGNWNGSGPGDINGDGTVDGIDLAILLGAWSPA